MHRQVASIHRALGGAEAPGDQLSHQASLMLAPCVILDKKREIVAVSGGYLTGNSLKPVT